MSRAPLTVHVLTHCVDPVLAYGTLLVFGSIRTGFPTARIEVVDNGSCAAMVPRIRAAAESVGASFEARPLVHYSDHWFDNLFVRTWPEPDGPVVFVDPDVVLWENCEGWDFGDVLMAGHLQVESPLRNAGNKLSARLHTSFLWVPSIGRLREAVHNPTVDLLAPTSEQRGTHKIVHDGLAPLYAAFKDRCATFGETELDCYDHLVFGSHLSALVPHIARMDRNTDSPEGIIDAHQAAAQGKIDSLRGLWRRREAARERAADLQPARQPAQGAAREAVPTICAMREWQGINADDGYLAQVNQALALRLHFGKPTG